MKPLTLFVGLVFAAGCHAAPSKDWEHKVKEVIEPPRGWSKFKPASANHVIDLRIGLLQSNFAQLEQHLYEIRWVLVDPLMSGVNYDVLTSICSSDPLHERYGAHLSKGEVEALVAPHEDSVNAVDEWLANYGLASHDVSRSPAGDWVNIRVPVSLANEMLKTVRLVMCTSPTSLTTNGTRIGVPRLETRGER